MRESLTQLSREQAQTNLKKVEPSVSVSESIADELSLTVFDQKEASLAVGRRLAMWQSGLTEQDKPIGILFFAGPPGVGKSEMAHAISQYFFTDRNSPQLIRLDMSDYQEAHTAQKLTGSPPGYVGYDETPAIPHHITNQKNKPTIVLLDEIEKAHPNVLKGLLQAFDKGEINARNGREGFEPVDLTRTLFIMTSNIASDQVVQIEKHGSKRIGFGSAQETRDDEIHRVVKEAMKAKFPPEFLDRVDQFVRFMPLESEETRRAILMKFVKAQNDAFIGRWAGDAPYIALTHEAQVTLLSNKDDKGGRGIKREFHQRVISQLADVMIGMDFKRRPFVADIEDGKTVWYTDVRDPVREELRLLPRGDMNGDLVEEDGGKNEPPDTRWDGISLMAGGRNGKDRKKTPPQEDWEDDLENGEEPPQEGEINRNVRFHIPGGDKKWPIINISVQIHEDGRRDKIQIVEGIPLIEAL